MHLCGLLCYDVERKTWKFPVSIPLFNEARHASLRVALQEDKAIPWDTCAFQSPAL